MNQFHMEVRLDTPLMLGGRDGDLESSNVIRPASLRGLFHTFARAYLGYLLGGVKDEHQRARTIRTLESALLGAAASDEGTGGNTYRVAVLPEAMQEKAEFLLVPKPNGGGGDKGRGLAFCAGQRQTIHLTVPRRSARNRHFCDALLAVVWIALTLGSLGKRSRRGYGSLSIAAVHAMGNGGCGAALPTLANANDGQDLAERITVGLGIAEQSVTTWMQEQGVTAQPEPSYIEEFFQFGGEEQVYIGQAPSKADDAPWQPLMERFNQACHDGLSQNAPRYRKYIGKSNRLASPVWLRFHGTDAGHVAVVTRSSLDDVAIPLAQTLIDSVNAVPLPTWIKGARP